MWILGEMSTCLNQTLSSLPLLISKASPRTNWGSSTQQNVWNLIRKWNVGIWLLGYVLLRYVYFHLTKIKVWLKLLKPQNQHRWQCSGTSRTVPLMSSWQHLFDVCRLCVSNIMIYLLCVFILKLFFLSLQHLKLDIEIEINTYNVIPPLGVIAW